MSDSVIWALHFSWCALSGFLLGVYHGDTKNYYELSALVIFNCVLFTVLFFFTQRRKANGKS